MLGKLLKYDLKYMFNLCSNNKNIFLNRSNCYYKNNKSNKCRMLIRNGI